MPRFFHTFVRQRNAAPSNMSLHSVSNYDIMSSIESELPEHMRVIIRTGLNYLACVLDLTEKTVWVLRHARMDLMYVMVVTPESDELTQAMFDDGYPITYMDNPLQPGIAPRWSDQNRLSGQAKALTQEQIKMKSLSLDEYIERQEQARAAEADLLTRQLPGP